ncbi:MAG: HAD family hydrolase [Eubacteriales bacterium]
MHCADKTKPYEGILELISKLKKEGLKTAVISNKADYAVQILLEQYFNGLFDVSVGERSGVRKKPAPDTVNEVLKTLNCSPDEAIYVGDSEVDIETAKNAGIECIIVGWGFRDKDFLIAHGAKTVVSDPAELHRMLSK